MSPRLDDSPRASGRRNHIWVPALVGLLLAGTSAAAEATTAPPADIPDLAAIDLGVGDLPRGATVEHQRYVPELGTVAAYERSFTFSHPAMRRSHLVYIDGKVALFERADDAFGIFSVFRQGLHNRRSRRAIARIFARDVRAKNVHVFKARDLHLTTTSAVALPVTVVEKRLRLTAVLAVMTRDRVVGQLSVVTTSRRRQALRRTRGLLVTMSDHVGVELSPRSTSSQSSPAPLGSAASCKPMQAAGATPRIPLPSSTSGSAATQPAPPASRSRAQADPPTPWQPPTAEQRCASPSPQPTPSEP